VKVSFPRPRDITIEETGEFNALCTTLRDLINKACQDAA
jgi:hypothetical protein